MNQPSRDNANRIAIIGMAGRFPGARDVNQFWRNLCDGVESISFFTDDELRMAGVEENLLRDPAYVKAAGVLDGIELFDAELFAFTPREAEITDPQHRLFLECAWESLENAGYDSHQFAGRIGVYAGAGPSSYLIRNLLPRRDVLANAGEMALFLGNNKDFVPTRVCYKLDLKGPGINVNTACSSSLVSVHLACQALMDYQCDMALAGGVGIQVPQRQGYVHQTGGIGSPDGHCRAFDARAAGTVSGNGVGIVVLKRLEDALKDGDFIHAVILGSAVNNDGAAKVGYTAPSVMGQAEVIAEALALADVDANSITYVEAHGTGTRLGDPIEIAALTQSLGGDERHGDRCAIGSVKTNVGHLDEAAGVAGLIKTVLALREGQIPPTLHFQRPNAEIDFQRTPFFVNSKLLPWQTNGAPRRAGVSSFGIGGTNAHLVLEEAPSFRASRQSRPWQLLAVSARTNTALAALANNLAQHLESNPDEPLADVCYTLQVGRTPLAYRCAFVCHDTQNGITSLRRIAAGSTVKPLTNPQGERPVAFLFPGQGAQYLGMGREIYETEPVFRNEMDRCAERIAPLLGFDVRELLYSRDSANIRSPEERLGQDTDRGARLSQTSIAQPVLFSFQYSFAQLWKSWGVEPQAMLGHSLGQYVAATLANVLTLDDALVLVAERGRLLQQVARGGMLAVGMTEGELQSLLGSSLSLAAVNSPSMCVVSGPEDAIAALEEQLASRDIFCRHLHTSHAFHSAVVQPAVEAFAQIVRKVKLKPPQIPFLSNVSGTWITADEATDPDYWAKHMRATVRFSENVEELLRREHMLILELGPGQTLATIVRQHANAAGRIVMSCTAHPQSNESAAALLTGNVGQLWEAGGKVDWRKFHEHHPRQRLPLPTYPFERMRYWIDPPTANAAEVGGPISRTLVAATERRRPKMDGPNVTDANGGRTSVDRRSERDEVKNWIQAPAWRSSEARAAGRLGAPACWLVFVDDVGLTSALSARLRSDGHTVVEVASGVRFERLGPESFVIAPARAEDYATLWDALLAEDRTPSRILHLWNVTRPDASLTKVEDHSFFSLLFLAQVVGSRTEITELRIDVISNGLHRVDNSDTVCAEKALLLGPVRVMPLEYPQLRCRSIDVVLDESNSQHNKLLTDRIFAELVDGSDDTVIALRGNRRCTPTLEPVADRPAKGRLRERGTYLITGGLGSMGLAMAQHLAEKVRARLVLVGRSSPPTVKADSGLVIAQRAPLASNEGSKTVVDDNHRRQIRKLEDIQRAGGEVLVVQADVTNKIQMQRVVEQVRQKFGAIHGVIHAAGVLGQRLIHNKTVQQAQAVLAPKVSGARILEAVLDDQELDFFVMCSSMASTSPIAGQVDYCAANAFLDAFAHETSRHGTQRMSVDWGFWQELGMIEKSDMPQSDKQDIVQEIERKGWSQAGVAAFEHILQCDGIHQVLVSPDFARESTQSSEMVSHPWFESRLIDASGQETYIAHLSPERHWVLDEHRLHGKPTLPGTSYLEMARAAFTFREGEGPVELRNVYFLTPLILGVGELRETRTVLIPRGDGFSFHVVSRVGADRWLEHARGEVLRHSRTEEARAGDGLVERCRQLETAAPSSENGFARRVAAYPPRWRNIVRFQFEDQEGLALIQLPGQFTSDVELYGLHPALLDNATGFLSHHDNLERSLPFCYQRVVIYRPLPSQFFSRVIRVDDNRAGMRKYNVLMLDSSGAALIQVDGFTLREVEDESSTSRQLQAHEVLPTENFHVEITSPGYLESLRFRAAPRREPGAGELEIEVAAAGLNFIEVLYALGMLPTPAGMHVRFGLECSGRVAKVGRDVNSFAVGDEVIAMSPRAFSRYTIASAGATAHKPDHLSFLEAATLPAAYATAWYALIVKANLRRGERVLIHSATGGVGLAAVNIAKHVGAEIFATAGNEPKREYLRNLGIEKVLDSRSLDFADHVLAYTGGEGVDVVLNSLGGEFIARSLSVLRRYGRFLELGKRDMFAETHLNLKYFENHLSFIAIDVGPDMPDFDSLWRAVVQRIHDGTLPPLANRAFAITELTEAIEYMAQAKHIGKILLEIAGCQVTPTRLMAEPVGLPLTEIIGPLESAPERSASPRRPTVSPAGHQRPELESPYVAPRTETEAQLVEIWQQLLGIDRVGVDDNFFDLRGDSLLAAQLVSRVRRVFHVALPISIVFDATTVASQAERIIQLRQPISKPETAAMAAVELEVGDI